jgi:hypothetical protein
MDSPFFVPIAAMLTGLGTWVAYLIARAASATVKGWPSQVPAGLALAAGGLIAFSAYA